MFLRLKKVDPKERSLHFYPTAGQLLRVCQTWELIVAEMFSTPQALEYIDSFGRYVMLRQKKIYQTIGQVDGFFTQIYKTGNKHYKHGYFDAVVAT